MDDTDCSISLFRAYSVPLQLELSKQQAAETEADLRASTQKELHDARLAAAELQAKVQRDIEETRQASAGGARELTERAERREEVRRPALSDTSDS